jgi:hypothetical protein
VNKLSGSTGLSGSVIPKKKYKIKKFKSPSLNIITEEPHKQIELLEQLY